MQSHELAAILRRFADSLDEKPNFETPGWCHVCNYRPEKPATLEMSYSYKKEPFLEAVRALGSGKKEYIDTDSSNPMVTFTTAVGVQLKIERNLVCRKVRDAIYQCDPLLSAEEEAVLGGTPQAPQHAFEGEEIPF